MNLGAIWASHRATLAFILPPGLVDSANLRRCSGIAAREGYGAAAIFDCRELPDQLDCDVVLVGNLNAPEATTGWALEGPGRVFTARNLRGGVPLQEVLM